MQLRKFRVIANRPNAWYIRLTREYAFAIGASVLPPATNDRQNASTTASALITTSAREAAACWVSSNVFQDHIADLEYNGLG